MKKIAMLCTMIVVCLSGCKSDQISRSKDNSQPSSKPNPPHSVVTVPNGRWFSNPLHCRGKIPISGTYDFSILNSTLTYMGITDNGTWKDDGQNEQAVKAFSDLLVAESTCLANASMPDFQMVKFVGKITEYWFAYSAKNNLLLRYNSGSVDIIVPFEVDKIKLLQLEDNTDASLPIDELSQSVEPINVETAETASH